MKKLVILLMLSNPVYSYTQETCDTVLSLTSNIMEVRQYNGDMVKTHKLMTGQFAKEVVLEAMDTPIYKLRENKQQKIKEFGLRYYKSCVSGDL